MHTYTFMSRWTTFFIYFQVLYLFVVICTLTVVTLVLFFEHINMNEDELYEEYVENQLELYENGIIPSKEELL